MIDEDRHIQVSEGSSSGIQNTGCSCGKKQEFNLSKPEFFAKGR
jgi:hypothetical protein